MWWSLLACHDPDPRPDDRDPPTSTPTPTEHSGGTTGDPPLVFRGARPKNVLVISIDTTRRDEFGDRADTMPFTRSLMEQSVVLEDHQQCSNWTYASTSCTLNGRYHEENGFAPALRSMAPSLPDGQVTLATRLRDAGYDTLLLSPNSWLGPGKNNAQGYDDVRPTETGRTEELFAVARTRLTEHLDAGADRWLMHVHLMEPHPPYVPPESTYEAELEGVPPLPPEFQLDSDNAHYSTIGQWPQMTPETQEILLTHLWARYRGELRWMDQQLSIAWPLLDAAGVLDDTLVVFWTDHGEQFFERDHQTHAWHLNTEENDAVMFVWARNLEPSRWDEPTHAVDFVPTVLSALGMPADADDPHLSGYALGSAPIDRPRFGMSVAREGVLQSVTQGSRKLVFDWDDGVQSYDRAVDPGETTSIFDPTSPEDLALWALLAPRVPMLQAAVPDERLIWPDDLPRP